MHESVVMQDLEPVAPPLLVDYEPESDELAMLQVVEEEGEEEEEGADGEGAEGEQGAVCRQQKVCVCYMHGAGSSNSSARHARVRGGSFHTVLVGGSKRPRR